MNKIIIFIVALAVFVVVNLVLFSNNKKGLIESAFEGKIERIDIGDKGIPNVYVNGSRYHLTTLGNEFIETVKAGDYIIKNKGEARYKIIRRGTSRVLNFTF